MKWTLQLLREPADKMKEARPVTGGVSKLELAHSLYGMARTRQG